MGVRRKFPHGDTTGYNLVVKLFKKQQVKGVLLHKNMEDFVGIRSVLNLSTYVEGPNGEVRRRIG